MDIKAATEGKKTSELAGDLKEFKSLGLKLSNIIAAMDIVGQSAHEKKGYVLGYLNRDRESAKTRRAVLTALYAAKPEKK